MNRTCFQCGGELQTIKDRPYHYTESGLDNVVIFGINQYECKACDEIFVSIPKLEQLHLLLGRELCCKKGLLSGQEIRFLRKEIHMKGKELANALGVTPPTISRWENDREEIGETQDRLLRSLYMLFASEQTAEVLHKDAVRLFSELPRKRKRAKKPTRLEFTPADWMGEQRPQFCQV
jgi:putative zinc finger/helix-turn-helix YgiT family protein